MKTKTKTEKNQGITRKKSILKLVLKSCKNLTNFVLGACMDQNEKRGTFIYNTTVVCRRRLGRFCCCAMNDMEDPATLHFNLIFFTGFELKEC